MKQNVFKRNIKRKGFTLIELLVVVLIIGILAVVALPQYQRAVDKTNFTQYIALGQKIRQAEEVYRLMTGEYTVNLNNLDIDFTGVCPTVCGPANNELCDCSGGFLVNITSPTASSVMIGLCPGYNSSNWSTCAPHSVAYLLFPFGSQQQTCHGNNARGQRICASLSN